MKRRQFLGSVARSAGITPFFLKGKLSRTSAAADSGGATKGSSKEFRLGMVHYQWEFPQWMPDAGKHLDMKAYIAGLVEGGVEAVHVLVDAEPGVYHYATKVGFERDPSGRDFLREVLDEIRRQKAEDKLKVVVYFTVSWNNAAAKHKPEWQQVDQEGKPLWIPDAFGHPMWAYLCINSPYRDYQFASLKEIADSYPEIIGFWLDEPLLGTLFDVQGCYCHWCEEAFKRSRGYGLPRDSSAPKEKWLQMKKFQVESVLRYFDDLKQRVLTDHPHLTWTWNGVCTPCDWEPRLWTVTGYSSVEVQAGYLEALTWAKRLAGYKHPFELTLGNDYSWCDQRIRPEHELKTFQAITVAHGGGELIGDYPYPDGRFREHKFEWCKGMLHHKRALDEWLEGAESLADIAVFESLDSNWVRYVRSIQPKKGAFFFPWHPPMSNVKLYGWSKILSDANLQFDLINELRLEELSKYKLIILPDQFHLAEETVDALERYVAAGGRLLATFRSGLFDQRGEFAPSRLWKLLGLKVRGMSEFRGNYIRLANASSLSEELPAVPLLVIGGAVLTELDGAEALAWVTFPIEELTSQTRVWFDYNPARADSTPHPAVAAHQFGRGQTLYVAHPVEERYIRGSYWALGRLMLNAVRRLVPDSLVELAAPCEVRAIVNVQKAQGRAVVHLLNEANWVLSTAYVAGGQSRWASEEITWGPDSWARNQSPYPWKRAATRNVEIRLKAPFERLRHVYEAPEQTAIPFTYSNGDVRFTVPMVDTHTVVVVEA